MLGRQRAQESARIERLAQRGEARRRAGRSGLTGCRAPTRRADSTIGPRYRERWAGRLHSSSARGRRVPGSLGDDVCGTPCRRPGGRDRGAHALDRKAPGARQLPRVGAKRHMEAPCAARLATLARQLGAPPANDLAPQTGPAGQRGFVSASRCWRRTRAHACCSPRPLCAARAAASPAGPLTAALRRSPHDRSVLPAATGLRLQVRRHPWVSVPDGAGHGDDGCATTPVP